jgi:hypothetical protein
LSGFVGIRATTAGVLMDDQLMTTTHLFVELLVIGCGAMAWLVLLAAALFGFSPSGLGEHLFSLAALFPVLALAYVLGILVDRIADWMLEKWDRKHLQEFFGEDRDAYFRDRRTLITGAPALWNHLEYGRSRLRICRGWALNAALLLLSFNLFLIFGQKAPSLSPIQILCFNLGLLLVAALCILSWRALNRKEYKKIQRQSEWVRQGIT